MTSTTSRTKQISVRISPKLLKALERKGRERHLKVAGFVHAILEDWISSNNGKAPERCSNCADD